MNEKRKILFVCLGNIVRSPLAENLFHHMIRDTDMEHAYEADSAGTSSYHIGERPDRRMRQTAAEHGVEVRGRSRQVSMDDLDRFDLIIAMDQSNYDSLQSMSASADQQRKIRLMREFDPQAEPGEGVPDPWYGGIDGFEKTYTIVERSVAGLIEALQEDE
jgi:protein-tyrosine phosphatase